MERTTCFGYYVRQSSCVERFQVGSTDASLRCYWDESRVSVERGRRSGSVFEDEWIRESLNLRHFRSIRHR